MASVSSAGSLAKTHVTTNSTGIFISNSKGSDSRFKIPFQKWMESKTTAERACIIDSPFIAGLHYLSGEPGNPHLRALYALGSESVPDPDDSKPNITVVYGNRSNDPKKLCPWVLSGELLGSVLVITSHEDASAAFKKGLKIVKTGNTDLINLVPALADGTSCLVAVPISIVFGFNNDTSITVGPLSQSIYDSLLDISTTHNEWASLLGKFDPVAAATISANSGPFAKYLPRKDPNASYSTTFVIGGNMYDEDHDADKEVTIEERLAAIIGDSTASCTASAQ